MAKASEVLQMLCAGSEYVSYGQNYEDIDWLGKEAPITKEQFEAGFAQVDAIKAQAEAAAQAQKQAILDRLGLTQDELRIVLG